MEFFLFYIRDVHTRAGMIPDGDTFWILFCILEVCGFGLELYPSFLAHIEEFLSFLFLCACLV